MHPKSIAALLAVSFPAYAFTLETAATDGCHEKITAAALKRSQWPGGAVAPAPTGSDRTLAENVPFHPPHDADPWTVAMLLGVRENDVGDTTPNDLPAFAAVQNGDGMQREHCLRELDDTGGSGDTSALAECKRFILSEVAAALGPDGTGDPSQTELQSVGLIYQDANVPLSRYAFHFGRASHALEDSFAHTFRTHDQAKVVSVLSYIGPRLEGYRPSADGYPHLSHLDSCDPSDPAAKARTEAATQAVAELIDAAGQGGDREARLSRASAVLDRWLEYVPGCDQGNDWCGNAPAQGCSATGSAGAAAIAALWVVLSRRRRALPLFAVVACFGALTARAEPQVEAAVEPAAPHDSKGALRLGVGTSFDRGAANFSVGARLKVSNRLTVGLDLEYSPWFDLLSARAQTGTANSCLNLAVRWTPEGKMEVRSVVDLGVSVLLFDAVGASGGSVGPFAGLSPLQLLVHLTDSLALELTPEIVVSVPSLQGVPLVYRQYRATIGFQWAL